MKTQEETDKITISFAKETVEKVAVNALYNKFAFYGTLRAGDYNYQRLVEGAAGLKFVEKRVVGGFKMYSLGPYPCAVKTGNPSDTIVVELYEIPLDLADKNEQLDNERRCRFIHSMEMGAGYGVEMLEINNEVYWLYVYPEREYDERRYTRVTGGDWITFKEEENKKRKRTLSSDYGW